MAKILIIDDDKALCRILDLQLRHMGHTSSFAHTFTDGLNRARKGAWDVVFLDVRLPDGNGLNALPVIRAIQSTPEVIIFTGEGDPDGAEVAIRGGAWDYVEKPPSLSAMTLPLMRALEYRAARSIKHLELLKREGIVGRSPEIEKCLNVVSDASRSEEGVLIMGETGTGKELFAKAIHENSKRSDRDFVVVDCAALPETLAESTLFGHEKGAFTSASTARTGLVKQADGGTLFLDEVGELPLTLQKSFLRVLQEKTFRPLGSQRELRSDFRLVAATNRDLNEMVREGFFREDLLFRIKSWVIQLPPLRKRGGDIIDITLHCAASYSKRTKVGIKGFSPEFIEALLLYPWPGNVRELVKTLELALENSRDDPTLYPKQLPAHIRIHAAQAGLKKIHVSTEALKPNGAPLKDLPPLKEYREGRLSFIEKEYLRDLMRVTGGNIKKACEMSGLSRSRLYSLLQWHKIS